MSTRRAPLRSVRWYFVLPISFALFGSAVIGWAEGLKTAAFLSFAKRDFKQALSYYLQINDRSGAGMTLLAMNRPDEARNYFEQAQDKSGLGLVALAKHDVAAAKAHFQQINDNRGLGLAHLQAFDADSARAAFSRANDWSGLGLTALATQRYGEARSAFLKAGDESGLGLTSLKEQKFDEALAHFTKAKDSRGLGLVALARRDYDLAAKHFSTVNDQSGLGAVATAQGRWTDAEQFYKQVNDYDGLGDMQSQLHQFAHARESFAATGNVLKVMQSFRNDYTLRDKLDQALLYGQQAVAAGRQVPECRLEMANILYDQGKPQEALAMLDQVVATPGYASQAHLYKGRIYFYLRDFAKAKAEFSQVSADAVSGNLNYETAQQALKTIARYETLTQPLQPAESF